MEVQFGNTMTIPNINITENATGRNPSIAKGCRGSRDEAGDCAAAAPAACDRTASETTMNKPRSLLNMMESGFCSWANQS